MALRRQSTLRLLVALGAAAVVSGRASAQRGAPSPPGPGAAIVLPSTQLQPLGSGADARALRIDGLFYETAQGRTRLPADLTAAGSGRPRWSAQRAMPDGRTAAL